MLEQLERIKEKEVSRREFLLMIGLSIVSIVGFSDIIRILNGKSHKDSGSTYNSGEYGG